MIFIKMPVIYKVYFVGYIGTENPLRGVFSTLQSAREYINQKISHINGQIQNECDHVVKSSEDNILWTKTDGTVVYYIEKCNLEDRQI